jgi:N-acetylneuraminic acid mutarotase
MENGGELSEVKLFFEEIPAISDEEDNGPVITYQDKPGGEGEQEEMEGLVEEGKGEEENESIFNLQPAAQKVQSGSGKKKRKGKKNKKKRDKAGNDGIVSFSAVKSTAKPESRGGSSLSQVGSQLYLIGGANRCQEHYSDVHTIDLKLNDTKKPLAWKKLAVSGDCPSARSGHTTVCHNDTIYMFGGINMVEEEVYNDLYALDTATGTWTKLNPTGTPPSQRNEHSTTLVGNKMIVFGGSHPETGPLSDIHVLNLAEGGAAAAWEQPACSGAIPKARGLHATFLSRRNNKTQLSCDGSTSYFLNILGGHNGQGTVFTDMCTLNLDDFSWTPPVEIPSFGRMSHTACMVDGGNVIVYGGFDGKKIYNEAAVLNMETNQWRDLDASKTMPPGRIGHSMHMTPAAGGNPPRVYIYGGVNEQSDLGDLTEVRYEPHQ